MRVGLLGLFGYNNFGNEASLASAIRSMRCCLQPADLFCICPKPRKVIATHAIEAIDFNLRVIGDYEGFRRTLLIWASRFRLLRVVKVLQAYARMRGVSAIVIPGTGILDDFGLDPQGVPSDLLLWCAVARLRRAKVIFVSAGAGPITNPRSLWLMKKAARLATHRSFRDTASRDFMKSKGLDVSGDRVVPDIVFSMEPDGLMPSQDPGTGRLVVGVGVMNYRGWNVQGVKQEAAYLKHIEDTAQIVIGVLDRGHSVRLIMGEAGDQGALEDVLERVGVAGGACEERCVAPSLDSYDDLFRELQECDLVVGTRFHNVVCSLILGKPVLSVGYAAKNRDLLAAFGLGKYAHDIETLSVDCLMEQFDEVVTRRLEFQESILCKTLSYRAELEEYLEGLWKNLEG